MKDFGTTIKEYRQQHNLSVEELAKATKKDTEYIIALEDNAQIVLPSFMLAITELYSLSETEVSALWEQAKEIAKMYSQCLTDLQNQKRESPCRSCTEIDASPPKKKDWKSLFDKKTANITHCQNCLTQRLEG